MADNVTRPVEGLDCQYIVYLPALLNNLTLSQVKGPNTSKVPRGSSSRSPHSAAECKPCQHSKDGRNLVVCIDGTANQFGEKVRSLDAVCPSPLPLADAHDKNTNVIELYNFILKEVEDNQRTWYNSGIGTYARPSWKSLRYYGQVVYHLVDLAIAWGFDQTVLAAYRWLSDNYERGDCIFLFGFSRGAYQVRVLSAMIDKVGLIYKGNEMQIPFAYELYRDPKSDEISGSSGVHTVGSPDMTSSAERFKKAFSYKDVRVHFVGAWDTVSSIGIVRGKRMLPRTIDGMKHVCYFRHALALDERRVKFLPEYAYGGDAKPPANSEGNIPSPLWFAGTHSDIGGGNAENSGMNRSRPPLRWMVFEAGALGLRTAPFERTLLPEEQIDIRESLTWVWWPLELLFFNRLTYTRREQGKQTTHKPHLGSSRKIHAGQKIHGSLMLSNKMGKDYTPKARPLGDDPSFWAKAHAEGLGDWLAADLYEFAQTLVEKFLNEMDNTALQTLPDGRQAVYDGVIGGLRSTETATETKYQLLKSTVDIIPESGPTLKLCHSNEVQNLISDLRESNNKDYQEMVRQFLEQFTDREAFGRDLSWITFVAFSADGEYILSGSADSTIQIWDAKTRKKMGGPLRGHTDRIISVAFSPDGRRVISGSLDRTVRLWDAETREPIGQPLQGHTAIVDHVAFSPDGKHVFSCSQDTTVRIWDVETGKPTVGEPFLGHTDWVYSVAFSPDGRHLVSGSSDKTLRIWDVETRESVGKPLRGHLSWVKSVAFSLDGGCIVSGSSDHTLRIWDVVTGRPIGEPFQGHTSFIDAVAFSPDGMRVASGSKDSTIRIWDVKTGELVGEPFRGHTGAVGSVAFSPDGRRVISGSADYTVRIWDVESRETKAPVQGSISMLAPIC
ncbi:hypothetical protein GALMADRAFT_76068 [Galerina marginata CBS 339.88]|uniref:T6SS Phospholipase effector Tle1-like catalytic domain-containing protein n=1 Tax=Galerina marginata (strain CBS 339.88) TaxID=685588 RepID=A0A067SUR1_GALM3|nr:hypothetical protein GALMADRAFT_76068 [Galerina marginata CBS 339.88]